VVAPPILPFRSLQESSAVSGPIYGSPPSVENYLLVEKEPQRLERILCRAALPGGSLELQRNK